MKKKTRCTLVKDDLHIKTWIQEELLKKGMEIEVAFDNTMKERGWAIEEESNSLEDDSYRVKLDLKAA